MIGLAFSLAIIFAGCMLYRRASGVEAAITSVHRSIGIIPAHRLTAMRGFNIISLRIVAIVWIGLGAAALALTFTKFVSE